jgi:enamine deaminase RidA (YjgF/YER057c/UK114 family)
MLSVVTLRCTTRGTRLTPATSRLMSTIKRIGVDDPRMSKVVVHGGVVYMSGQTDSTASDSECYWCLFFGRSAVQYSFLQI